MNYPLLNSVVEIFLHLFTDCAKYMFLSSLRKTCKIDNRKLILSFLKKDFQRILLKFETF